MAKFNPNKLKVHLKSSLVRLNMMRARRQNTLVKEKHEIADLLQKDKEELAAIKVESVFSHDLMLLCYARVEIYLEKVLSRVNMLPDTIPENLAVAIYTLIYVAPLMDIPELIKVSKSLAVKYGQTLIPEAQSGNSQYVDMNVVSRIGRAVLPDQATIVEYFRTIAAEHDFTYTPSANSMYNVNMQAQMMGGLNPNMNMNSGMNMMDNNMGNVAFSPQIANVPQGNMQMANNNDMAFQPILNPSNSLSQETDDLMRRFDTF
eukprot:TRINITY_DN1554_c0_g1_i1.p1 TRINITY_DN1554_c0_g1~~TRINITY_DN1554_c0_g1_i1.p1  ORF type:complete len:261 (+),score=64.11 TRINITY_DN1554_c0_g1_i1:704-1486(+)